VGEIPLDLQPKLLRALEKREIRRVGESAARKIDVRVVAATNRDLAAEVNRGAFREDLYFRLAVVRVRLPPLRQRRGDIPLLVRHLVRSLAPGTPEPSPELVQAMVAKPWPGNVRELRNALQRALALIGSAATVERPAEGGGSSTEGPDALFGLPFKDALERWTVRFEQAYLEHALGQSGGSVTGAARLMGVNRRFVHRLLSRHDLRAERDDAEDEPGET
jgi:DNA-binding NtrC family response regulator